MTLPGIEITTRITIIVVKKIISDFSERARGSIHLLCKLCPQGCVFGGGGGEGEGEGKGRGGLVQVLPCYGKDRMSSYRTLLMYQLSNEQAQMLHAYLKQENSQQR